MILIPDLLPVKQPPFDFPTDDMLRFRFEYGFLPRSVMPRLIVNEHADIEGELRWRTGVVLRDAETRNRATTRGSAAWGCDGESLRGRQPARCAFTAG